MCDSFEYLHLWGYALKSLGFKAIHYKISDSLHTHNWYKHFTNCLYTAYCQYRNIQILYICTLKAEQRSRELCNHLFYDCFE